MCLIRYVLPTPVGPTRMTFCFAYSGLLRARRIFFLQLAQIIRVIVMIADRDREDLLRLVLLDHEPVEMRLDVARQKIENEIVLVDLLRRLFSLLRRAGFRFGLSKGRERNPVAEVLFHELRDLGLQFLR